jgi:hypothetical protein
VGLNREKRIGETVAAKNEPKKVSKTKQNKKRQFVFCCTFSTHGIPGTSTGEQGMLGKATNRSVAPEAGQETRALRHGVGRRAAEPVAPASEADGAATEEEQDKGHKRHPEARRAIG